MPDTFVQVLGFIASGVVAVIVARFTSRAAVKSAEVSSQAAVKSAEVSSRAVVEEEAYERAKELWKDGIADLKETVTRTAERAQRAERMVETLQEEKGALSRQLDAMERELRECKTLCRRLVAHTQADDPPTDFTD